MMPTPDENRRARLKRYRAAHMDRILERRRVKRLENRLFYESGNCNGCGKPITIDDQIAYHPPRTVPVHNNRDCKHEHRKKLKRAVGKRARIKKSQGDEHGLR